MWTLVFWKGAAERAFKTFCQALVAIIGVNGLTLLTVPWGTALATAGLAALLSALTSMATMTTVVATSPPKTLPSQRAGGI